MEPREKIEATAINLSPTARNLQDTLQAHAEAMRVAAQRALKKEQEEGASVDGSGVSSDERTHREGEQHDDNDAEQFRRRRPRPEEDEGEPGDSLDPDLLLGLQEVEEAEWAEVEAEAGVPPPPAAEDRESSSDAEAVHAPPASAAEPAAPPAPVAEVAIEAPVAQVAPEPVAVEAPSAPAPAAPVPDAPTVPAGGGGGQEPVAATPPAAADEALTVDPPARLVVAPRRYLRRDTRPRGPLPGPVAGLLDSLIEGPPGPARTRVRDTLAGFGARLLSQCRYFDVRVLVTTDPPSRVAASLGGATTYDGLASAYFAADRICWLHADRLDGGDEFGDPVALTFASAIDHSMGEDGFASRRSPAVQASYQAGRQHEPGHALLDGYCADSPQHYFAQAVAAWMTQPGGALQADDIDCYCSRSMLYDLDRSLYSYLQYLLRDTQSHA